MDNQQLLSVADAASILGVVTSRIRTLLIKGKLRGEKYGRDWMIRADDLREFEKTYKPTTGRPRGGKATKKSSVQSTTRSGEKK
jgi:excisionase family DNA binding protein